MAAAVTDQQAIFQQLIKTASKTEFGKEHHFNTIKTHEDFVKQVPVRDYEAFKPYIERIKEGKHNVFVGILNNKMNYTALDEAVKKKQRISEEWMKIVKILAT